MVKDPSKIQNLLSKHNMKLWVLINKDNTDQIFCEVISDHLYTLSMCFITEKKIYLLVHDLDKDNLEMSYLKKHNIQVVTYHCEKAMEEKIEDIISELGFIDNISLSYSLIGENETDILGHGEYLTYRTLLKQPYVKYKKKVKISCAENLMLELLCEKTEKQIIRLKMVANITENILQKTFSRIKRGMTEIEIATLVKQISHEVTKEHLGQEIIRFSLGWENCPFVLVGSNLVKGGHTLPSDKKVNMGDTIYIDFGMMATFFDGEQLCSDIQRMGYMLKAKEKKAPSYVQHVFNCLTNSIENALDSMKPGVKGYEIDNLVREKILKEGYPNYNHATGHPVGSQVHDIGTIISSRMNKRASLPLIENTVYTLEPRIATVNGASIEEMILVTKFGGIPITKMQKKLYLI